ncbi:uncharacterized protein LOC143222837 isoform X2 [Tachypleus tridentatus]|uniref:uncharacterized protein LOC143222837 isoform X2 n=1 Tax=Tachypleus tridentatus TaxID=6853 RepID=UPI003FD2D268
MVPSTSYNHITKSRTKQLLCGNMRGLCQVLFVFLLVCIKTEALPRNYLRRKCFPAQDQRDEQPLSSRAKFESNFKSKDVKSCLDY